MHNSEILYCFTNLFLKFYRLQVFDRVTDGGIFVYKNNVQDKV